MTTEMTGEKTKNNSFSDAYAAQVKFQEMVLMQRGENFKIASIPADSNEWFCYHMCAMVEELGEVMKADKRWKTHRNIRYEEAEKLDEIADIFITAMNMAIYSGFDSEKVFDAIGRKIAENTNRLRTEMRLQDV